MQITQYVWDRADSNAWLVTENGRVAIDPNLCAGCGLCAQVCPVGAIGGAQG